MKIKYQKEMIDRLVGVIESYEERVRELPRSEVDCAFVLRNNLESAQEIKKARYKPLRRRHLRKSGEIESDKG